MPEPMFMKLGIYIMANEPIWTSWIPHINLCVCLCIPFSGARQRLSNHVPAATNTHNRRIVGHVVFCAVRVSSKESLWVSMCISLSLLGNNSVKTFPSQRRIVDGVIFYAVLVVSNASRLLVLPRTSCSIWNPHGDNEYCLFGLWCRLVW
jgi:hypothetical protein